MLYDNFSSKCQAIIEQIKYASDRRNALILSAKLEVLKAEYYGEHAGNTVHAIKKYTDFYSSQERSALLHLAIIRDEYADLTGTEIGI